MAAPNIVNTATITGKTVPFSATTSSFAYLTNPSSSGKVYKINSILVSNINGTAPADITISVYFPASFATAYLAYTISVPNDSTLVVIDKNTSFYLEENCSISAIASVNSYFSGIISYEEIS